MKITVKAESIGSMVQRLQGEISSLEAQIYELRETCPHGLDLVVGVWSRCNSEWDATAEHSRYMRCKECGKNWVEYDR